MFKVIHYLKYLAVNIYAKKVSSIDVGVRIKLRVLFERIRRHHLNTKIAWI